MRTAGFFVILALSTIAAPGCGEDDHGDSDIAKLDDASDEVALTILEHLDRGDVEETADAAHLVAPGDGDTVAAGAPAHYVWELTQSALRHGRTTGDFVVLRTTCEGLDHEVVVVGIESTDWTVEADHWDEMVAAGGPCSVEVVSAYVSDGVIEEGPFVPGDVPSYTIE